MTRIPTQDDYNELLRRLKAAEEELTRLLRFGKGTANLTQRVFDLEAADVALAAADSSHASYATEIHNWLDERVAALEAIYNGGSIIALDSYVESPQKFTQQDVHGALLNLDTAHVLQTGADLTVSKGTGKVFIVVDTLTQAGEITISGTSVDRNTGVETPADSETILINQASTDATATDAQGNNVWDIEEGYMSSKWWTGSITLAEASVGSFKGTIDTYHCSYEQLNDAVEAELQTFDVNVYTTNANAWGYWYLYAVERDTNGRFSIKKVSDLSLASGSAIANQFWRLRRGNLEYPLNPTKDGLFVQIFLGPTNQTYFEDMTMKVWARAVGADFGLLSPDPMPDGGGGGGESEEEMTIFDPPAS